MGNLPLGGRLEWQQNIPSNNNYEIPLPEQSFPGGRSLILRNKILIPLRGGSVSIASY